MKRRRAMIVVGRIASTASTRMMIGETGIEREIVIVTVTVTVGTGREKGTVVIGGSRMKKRSTGPELMEKGQLPDRSTNTATAGPIVREIEMRCILRRTEGVYLLHRRPDVKMGMGMTLMDKSLDVASGQGFFAHVLA